MMAIDPDKQGRLRRLPSVDAVLRELSDFKAVPGILAGLVRLELEEARWAILRDEQDAENPPGGGAPAGTPQSEAAAAAGRVRTRARKLLGLRPSRVVNATGVLVHTNLGRSPLSARAIQHMAQVAGRYSDLEFDLQGGRRGSRQAHTAELLRLLTGAQDVLVVNNNAAAVLLVLAALAKDREVIVSRGELVEIGGSFRIPDVLEQSGAVLKEVGTTNRTHLADYQKAVGSGTGLILKVHPSNYRVEGFSHAVDIADCAVLARKERLPLVVDLGSGALTDLQSVIQEPEPLVQHVLGSGADVVTFSGDKLLGGPQAGIIAGSQDLLKRIKTHPLARAVRVDKLMLAALHATLTSYLDSSRVVEEIPLLKMFHTDIEELDRRATEIQSRTEASFADIAPQGPRLRVQEGKSAPGGGSLPGQGIATRVLVCDSGVQITAQHWQEALLAAELPVLTRIADDCLVLDLRTVFEDELEQLPDLLRAGWDAAQQNEIQKMSGQKDASGLGN